MPSIDASRISLELSKIVVKNGQVDLKELEKVASGTKEYSNALVSEANKLLISGLSGDKAWGDIGDQFVLKGKQQPVSREKYEAMLAKQIIPDDWMLMVFHDLLKEFLNGNKDKIEGKYIPNFGKDEFSSDLNDKLPVYDLLTDINEYEGKTLISHMMSMIKENIPTNEEFQMLEDGLSTITEVYSEFCNILRTVLPNNQDKIAALESEQQQIEKKLQKVRNEQQQLEKKLQKVNNELQKERISAQFYEGIYEGQSPYQQILSAIEVIEQ